MQHYRYEALQHPESIRVLILHPALDPQSAIRCHFLKNNPVLPTIQSHPRKPGSPLRETGTPKIVPSTENGGVAEEYQPRKVNIKPGSPDESHRSVDRPPGFPAYEALSYTWGDPMDPVPIHLSRRNHSLLRSQEATQFLATRNLFGALRSLRHRVSRRLLWIDAICIDQSNLDEKTTQVRLMDRVYAASHKVVVYLGEETPSSRILFRELALATRAPRRKLMPFEGEHPYSRRSPPIIRAAPDQAVINAMNDLFNRPYFQRIWVLQEAYFSCLASKPAIVLTCGMVHASIDVLYRCVFGYEESRRLTSTAIPLPIEYGTTGTGFGSFSSLWVLLMQSRRCQATDPRDRVFALRSLIPREDKTLDSLIDYHQTVETVFTNVATYLLSDEDTDLWLLLALRHPHQRPMPSWVPDWSQNQPIGGIKSTFDPYGSGRDKRYKTKMQLQVGAYSLSQQRAPDPGIPNYGPHLQAKGREFSRILVIGPKISVDNFPEWVIHLRGLLFQTYGDVKTGAYPQSIIEGMKSLRPYIEYL